MTNFYSEFERLIQSRANVSRIDSIALTPTTDFLQSSTSAMSNLVMIDPAMSAQMHSMIQETHNCLNRREEAEKQPIKKPAPLW